MKFIYNIILFVVSGGIIYGMQSVPLGRQGLQMLGRRYASTMSRQEASRVLNVPLNATAEQVRQARNVASKKVHPDVAARIGISREEATEQMKKINIAYDVLRSPQAVQEKVGSQDAGFSYDKREYNEPEDIQSTYYGPSGEKPDLHARLDYFKNPVKPDNRAYDNLTYYKIEYKGVASQYKLRILDTIDIYGALTVVSAFLQPSMRRQLLPFMEALHSSKTEGAKNAWRAIPPAYRLAYLAEAKGTSSEFYSLLNQQMEQDDPAQISRFVSDVSSLLDISPLLDKGIASLVLLPFIRSNYHIEGMNYDNLKKFLFTMPFDKQLILFGIQESSADSADRVRNQMGYLRLLNEVLLHHGSLPTDAELLFEIKYPEWINLDWDYMFFQFKNKPSAASFLYGFMFILSQPTPYTESLYDFWRSTFSKMGIESGTSDPFPEVTKLRNYLISTKNPQVRQRVKEAQKAIHTNKPNIGNYWKEIGKSWDWDAYSAY